MLKYYLFPAAVLLCLVSVCTLVRDNPIDENGSAFIYPTIEIDQDKSNIGDGDTIHFDSGTIAISGNRPECRLQWKVSSGAWTEWNSGAEAAIHLENLPDGICTVTVAARYSGGDRQNEREITFRVSVAGYAPSVLPESDTSLSVDEYDTLILAPEVSGAPPPALCMVEKRYDTAGCHERYPDHQRLQGSGYGGLPLHRHQRIRH